MKHLRLLNLDTLFLILIIITGGFLRFYKLDWGNGLFAHPDEYHIVIAANQLSFPTQMNPHFFSYGTFTIYLIYFTKTFLSFLGQFISFNANLLNPFLIGRFYSALFSTLTIYIIYKIVDSNFNRQTALLAAFLTAFTPGLVQQAHFTTPESNLIFCLFASLYFILLYVKNPQVKNIILSTVFLGLASGTKVSSLTFSPVILLALVLKQRHQPIKKVLSNIPVIAVAYCITFFIVDPYVFLDFPDFIGNLTYEGNLAAGTFVVFYTRQFIGTIPFLFQFKKIYPFAEGLILPFAVIGFIVNLFLMVKKKSSTLMILIISFLLIFIPNSLLFAKWTRFSSPVFPFLAIFASLSIITFSKLHTKIGSILEIILIISAYLWTLSFFSIYLLPDVRITASNWLATHTPKNSLFLIEEGNTVDLPLDGEYRRIGFNFYNLENNYIAKLELGQDLVASDYFLIQSRRVFANLGNKNSFPTTSKFYKLLFNGTLGFKEIAQFSSYPGLYPLGIPIQFPDEGAEETWSVFDHPVIRVYKKVHSFTLQEYLDMLNRANNN